MTTYAAWMHNVGARGAFASHNKRIITADDPEKIWQAFGGAAEAVELTTVDIDAWLAEQGRPAALLLDNPPKSAVPTPEELKASSRWRPIDHQDIPG